MNADIRDLLPEGISDETAFHLVNFAMELALALESIYLGKIRRYSEERRPAELPSFLRDKDE